MDDNGNVGGNAHLQRILPREALLAVPARERLHRQMDPLMSLQIMIPVEALRTLIALERPIVLLLRLAGVAHVHVGSHVTALTVG